jgi:hypothetical protein
VGWPADHHNEFVAKCRRNELLHRVWRRYGADAAPTRLYTSGQTNELDPQKLAELEAAVRHSGAPAARQPAAPEHGPARWLLAGLGGGGGLAMGPLRGRAIGWSCARADDGAEVLREDDGGGVAAAGAGKPGGGGAGAELSGWGALLKTLQEALPGEGGAAVQPAADALAEVGCQVLLRLGLPGGVRTVRCGLLQVITAWRSRDLTENSSARYNAPRHNRWRCLQLAYFASRLARSLQLVPAAAAAAGALFPSLRGAWGAGRARSRNRFAPPLTHFIPDPLTHSVPLYLKRQCDRTPQARGRGSSRSACPRSSGLGWPGSGGGRAGTAWAPPICSVTRRRRSCWSAGRWTPWAGLPRPRPRPRARTTRRLRRGCTTARPDEGGGAVLRCQVLSLQ